MSRFFSLLLCQIKIIDFDLRKKCLEMMVKKDANGFAIGGLAGGEAKTDFFKIVRYCCKFLPR